MRPSTMKALIKSSRAVGLKIAQVPLPIFGKNDVLIKVQAASICGSDVPIYNWDDPWTRETVQPGQIIGHEFCGTVVDCGQYVQHLTIGDFVTAEGHLNCGICSHCLRGEAHICPNLKLMGFDSPGSFAEYVSVPVSNVVKLPSLPLIIAALLDPFGNAVHATRQVNLANQTVLITGCGPLGLMCIILSKFSGARCVLATDIYDYRLSLAERIGADLVMNSKNPDWIQSVKHMFRADHGVDILFEMSGDKNAISEGFEVIRSGGQAIMMGLPKEPVLFDFANQMIARGITARGLVGRQMYATWDQAIKLLDGTVSKRVVDLRTIVTHRFYLEQYEEAFQSINSGLCGKVVLFMDESSLKHSYEEVPE